MSVIAVYNIKGGVGKTATCVNLAHLSALSGYKTLLVDLDPQGASSFYYNIKLGLQGKSKKILFGDRSIEDSIKQTEYANLDIIPADNSYRAADRMVTERDAPLKWLSSLLKPVKKNYDHIILDCPPNISLISENIFSYANTILVPVVPTVLSVLTYKQLLDFFTENKLDKDKLSPFFSMVEKRKNLHSQIMEEFLGQFGNTIDTQIPYSADVEKMGIYRAPITYKHPSSAASLAFKELWAKVLANT